MQYEVYPCEGRWLELASSMMKRGQVEGSIPSDREHLAGTEEVVVARQATQDGFLNVGVAVFYPPDSDHCRDCIWLDILYVSPEFRRQGVAKRLINTVREVARSRGFARISLGTMLGNLPMLGLATSEGMDEGVVYFDQPLARSE